MSHVPHRAPPRPEVRVPFSLGAAPVLACLLGACDAGSGASDPPLELVEGSNGFGRFLPHEVLALGPDGLPTTERVPIRSVDDLLALVGPGNPVLAATQWPVTAVLPTGAAGNHYLVLEFDRPLDLDSALATAPGETGSLGAAIEIVSLDAAGLTPEPVPGRAFVGGATPVGPATGDPPARPLEAWVALDEGGTPRALDVDGAQPGLGFPGTQSASFPGVQLLSASSLVFVVDSDGDLSTHETFPAGRQVVVRAGAGLRSAQGKPLLHALVGSSTVGPDGVPPEVLLTQASGGVPDTTPAFGALDVDPATTIVLRFGEPVQPLSVGTLASASLPALSSAVHLTFGPPDFATEVPFLARPLSPYDLSTWELAPAFAFPGSGPASVPCGTFDTVSISVTPGQISDLAEPQAGASSGNLNTLPAASLFTTGSGPGLVNAPVAPDVIYVGRLGGTPSLSVIDLNGFGQSTGDPTFDFVYGSFPAGNSNFPNNPNLKLQGSALTPPLFPGTCTVDGGSSGVFSLTRDSALDTRLVRSPLIESVEDVMIGQPLDLVYNNGKAGSGCLSGGGNVCAIDGLQLIEGGNAMQFAPHPNPPPLTFPPLCVQPFIGAREPTSVASAGVNLLQPGDPFGTPESGIPPSGLLSSGGNTGFLGPSPDGLPLNACAGYALRQQIGHFLYLIDRGRRELVVLNSNRMSVLERIPLPDPTDLAMSPNLDLLAVSNQKANSVSFVDIDPASSSFHQVVKTLQVEAGPRGIAWDPGNEGILVCCEKDGSAALISPAGLTVRKVLRNALSEPFDVCITQRQIGFGTNRNVWFGWILNRNGDLALYESGPDGINGWGFDDVIGIAEANFALPQRIAVDIRDMRGAVWIAHQNELGPDSQPTGKQGGALSNVVIESNINGVLVLGALFNTPSFRQMSLKLQGSFGSDVLTGVPLDVATDDMINATQLPNLQSPLATGAVKQSNGKSLVRGQVLNNIATGLVLRAKSPEYLFVAVPNSSQGAGVVDVIRLGSSLTRFDTDPHQEGIQSIPATDVRVLCDYWRQ
jgi:DNA-binding beta-propeller fold protein YncE